MIILASFLGKVCCLSGSTISQEVQLADAIDIAVTNGLSFIGNLEEEVN
jgi:hypothetical protein